MVTHPLYVVFPSVATHQKTQQRLKLRGRDCLRDLAPSRNASENPAGIETFVPIKSQASPSIVATHQKTQQGLKPTLRYTGIALCEGVATHQKTQQGLKLSYQ